MENTPSNQISKGKVGLALCAVLVALYQLGMPYVEETTTLQKESDTILKENAQIKLDTQSYDSAWEKAFQEKERLTNEQLPDTMNSALVIEYFLSRFEKNYPGKIQFTSVNNQSGTSDIKISSGKVKLSPRVSRYKVKANILQDSVVPYLEHIENFTGMLNLESFSLNQPQKGGPELEMDATLGLYLSPKEWVLPEKLKSEPPVPEKLTNAEEQSWFQVYTGRSTKSNERVVSNIEDQNETAPHFKISQIVGNGIIVDERMYEEGDTLKGWTITRVDGEKHSVSVKKGTLTRRIVIP